jgi:hypothetical protein
MDTSGQYYCGKDFFYLNLLNNTVQDKEPFATDWDLQFMKYEASDASPGNYVAETGVLASKGTLVAKATPVNVLSNDYSAFSFSDQLNAMGWNWEKYDTASNSYGVKDSLAYFIQARSGAFYKIVFTAFGGATTGVISFYVVPLTNPTAVEEVTANNVLSLFPNPGNANINVLLNSIDDNPVLRVYDINGGVLRQQPIVTQLTPVNITELDNGVYVISITSDAGTSSHKFVVAH